MDTDAESRPAGEASHRTKGLLRLTMACNERCPFCNVPAEDYPSLTPPMADTEAELQRFLDDGADTLTISGGEPTLLRKRLIPLVERARAGGIRYVELQTNAVLIDGPYAQALAAAGVTSAFVSFLSHVPELHDTLAGLAGAYPKCLRGIDAMLDAGIRVTLNPVTARITQHLVADYIDFVAERLPRVRFISMSAVQPHGRAREDFSLLPDYAILAESIRKARERAAVHGIEMVNPYCGLPLCVGWDDAIEQSVEAFEARDGGWRTTPGLDNIGNKSQGEPCRRCAVRTRCGGAWHAYWDERGGSGIHAPVEIVEPWVEGAAQAPAQEVLRAPGGATPSLLARAAASGAPTVWLWTDHLGAADVTALHASRVTDLAVELSAVEPDALREPLAVVRRLVQASRAGQPAMRLRVFVGFHLPRETSPTAVFRAASLALAVGVDGIRFLDGGRWRRLVDIVLQQHPGADVAAITSVPLTLMDG